MTKEQFKSLFDLYFDDIRKYLYYRSGNTALSSDLAQDTFMRIWEKRMQVIPGKDTGLIYKIAGDLFISHLRREKTGSKILPDAIGFEYETRSPEEELQFAELKETYERTIATMPEKQRVVYLMSRVDGRSYQEIAARLSLSIKAVEKRMHRALEMLRTNLKT